MRNILLTYRGQAFDTEIQPNLEKFKDDNIVLVVENQLTKNIVEYIIKDFNNIELLKAENFLNDLFMKQFDLIVGNYPYEKSVGPSKTEPIWHLFAEKAISLLKPNAIKTVIHPSAWRNAKSKFDNIKELYLSKKIISIELNDFKKGKEVFDAGTNFDVITIQNSSYEPGFKTKIVDVNGDVHYLDVGKLPFIPNSNFKEIFSLVALDNEESVNILYSSSKYEIRYEHMCDIKDEIFNKPCVYSITQKDGVKFWYSSIDRGYFNLPKVIWSNGLGTYPIVDKNGEYGLTQYAYGISDDVDNLENIKIAMTSEKFLNLMKSIRFTNHIYDYKIISTFRKDFWKEFI